MSEVDYRKSTKILKDAWFNWRSATGTVVGSITSFAAGFNSAIHEFDRLHIQCEQLRAENQKLTEEIKRLKDETYPTHLAG